MVGRNGILYQWAGDNYFVSFHPVSMSRPLQSILVNHFPAIESVIPAIAVGDFTDKLMGGLKHVAADSSLS
jgi:hypothetical protein